MVLSREITRGRWSLLRRGEADTDANHVITIAELGRFAERNVRETAARLNRDQRPLVISRDSTTVVAKLAP